MGPIHIDLYDSPTYADANADWIKSMPGAIEDLAAGESATLAASQTAKDLHATLKHIIGRHNQKYHGNRGAAGTLGRGRGESRTFAASVAAPAAPAAKPVSKPAPAATPTARVPASSMTAAKELDFDVVKRSRYYWKTGDHDKAPITGGNRQKFVDAARADMLKIASDPKAAHSVSDRTKYLLNKKDITQAELRESNLGGAEANLVAMVKQKTANDIRARMGASTTMSDVTNRMSQWASTSNDDNAQALAMQKSVSDTFGVPLSKWQAAKIKENSAKVAKAEHDYGKQNTEYLKAVQANTQEYFAKAGYKPDDTITVYRGMTEKGKKGKLTGPAKYEGNAVESWSMDVGEARTFADTESGGVILSARVKIRDILSTFMTGPGCLTEMEVLVFGSQPGQEVYVYDISE